MKTAADPKTAAAFILRGRYFDHYLFRYTKLRTSTSGKSDLIATGSETLPHRYQFRHKAHANAGGIDG